MADVIEMKEPNKIDPIIPLPLGGKVYILQCTMRTVRHVKEKCGFNLYSVGVVDEVIHEKQMIDGVEKNVAVSIKYQPWVDDPEQLLEVLRGMMLMHHRNDKPTLDDLLDIIDASNYALVIAAVTACYVAQLPDRDTAISDNNIQADSETPKMPESETVSTD